MNSVVDWRAEAQLTVDTGGLCQCFIQAPFGEIFTQESKSPLPKNLFRPARFDNLY